MKRILAMGLLGLAVAVRAGPDVSPVYVLAVSENPSVAVSLVRPADYAAVPVSLTSDHKDPVQRFEAIAAAKRLIQEKVRANGRIELKEGGLFLSARALSKLSSFSSSYEAPSTATLHLLLPLDPQAPDVFAAAIEMSRFIQGISFADKTQCTPGHLQLVVADPEQFRPELLRLIAQDVRRTQEQMGVQGALAVTGLQCPVTVRQWDESRVELFLDYTVSLNWTDP